MITAAIEGPHLRRMMGGPPSETSFRSCGLAGIVANFPTWRETSLGALEMSTTVGSRSGSGVETIPDSPGGLPCLSRRAFSSFRRSESGPAISTFQLMSQFFDFACDLGHAPTFFRSPCRFDTRLWKTNYHFSF